MWAAAPRPHRSILPARSKNATTSFTHTHYTIQQPATAIRQPIKSAAATNTNNKYAYAFLVSGCSEATPSYRGFLYNIVVATQRLRDMGSTKADFVVFIQMSSSTKAQTLPADEERLLQDDMNIHIQYLPKMRSSVHECFYAVVKEKFRILQLTQYKRVLFMDGDMMPLCNLDYMFELSDSENNDAFETRLKENVIFAEQREAANAGMFMLTPNTEDWELLQKEIRRKEEKSLTLEYPYWDEVEGWGAVITPPDYWRPINGSKLTRWNYHAVFADQGLLYFWTKYVKKSVSVIIGGQIEHWIANENGDASQPVKLERIDRDGPLDQYSCIVRTDENRVRNAPYRDYVHFTGPQKPWEFDLAQNVTNKTPLPMNPEKTMGGVWINRINEWRATLLEIKDQTGHSIPILEHGHGIWSTDNSTSVRQKQKAHDPPAGRYSTYAAMYQHIKAKKFFKWQQYETSRQ
ncbi:MAG: hypothetical protein SGILL_005719 [Bacillariaceae sp.]